MVSFEVVVRKARDQVPYGEAYIVAELLVVKLTYPILLATGEGSDRTTALADLFGKLPALHERMRDAVLEQIMAGTGKAPR